MPKPNDYFVEGPLCVVNDGDLNYASNYHVFRVYSKALAAAILIAKTYITNRILNLQGSMVQRTDTFFSGMEEKKVPKLAGKIDEFLRSDNPAPAPPLPANHLEYK
jgi:hypothetical protein